METTENLKQQKTTPAMNTTPSEQLIIDTILSHYRPATDNDENIELLSTIEIVNRFQGIATIDTNIVADQLADNGFSLQLVGDEYLWQLSENQ